LEHEEEKFNLKKVLSKHPVVIKQELRKEQKQEKNEKRKKKNNRSNVRKLSYAWNNQ